MSQQDLDIARWFAAEVHPHEPALRSYLRAHFPSLRDIDDLVQETYARLIQARHTGHVADARPYLFSTARNAAIDLCRRNQIVVFEPIANSNLRLAFQPEADAAALLDYDQELTLLSEAIETLPERCRKVLTLRKLRGFSHRRIADELGISENTVSAQITIGVFRVREYFKARGFSRSKLDQEPRRVLSS